MHDSKDSGADSDYGSDATGTIAPDRETGMHAGDSPDVDGWQQYRKWISTAPAPRTRRGSVDPALYTWKGYRNWTEQVKRKWSDS